MGLYEMHLSMSLLGFGMWTMFANFHMCGIMLLLRAVDREKYESKRAYVFLVSLYLVCHDLVSCYFCVVLLPLGPELW